MKPLSALALIVVSGVISNAACGGPKPQPESALVKEGSAVPDTCCCKSNPMSSEDGKPAYDMANRMECSTKQGECVDDVQCKTTQQPE